MHLPIQFFFLVAVAFRSKKFNFRRCDTLFHAHIFQLRCSIIRQIRNGAQRVNLLSLDMKPHFCHGIRRTHSHTNNVVIPNELFWISWDLARPIAFPVKFNQNIYIRFADDEQRELKRRECVSHAMHLLRICRDFFFVRSFVGWEMPKSAYEFIFWAKS